MTHHIEEDALVEPKAPRVRSASRLRTVLLTGFPAFSAKRMLSRILAEPNLHAIALVQERFVGDFEAFRAALPGGRHRRVEPLVGDVAAMDLGLSGSEIRRLCTVSEVFHMASIFYLGVSKEETTRVNVNGTRHVLELAESMRRLDRFHHFSTAFVSGRREGTVLETDLTDESGFYNHYEETRFRAEDWVRRAMRVLPITVYRPSIIVGDSQTGEIDRFSGPYHFIVAIVNAPLDVPLPLPGRGDTGLNLVAIDYVVEAA
jgi:thioester reductase-like protein